jgi:hypothetical protein
MRCLPAQGSGRRARHPADPRQGSTISPAPTRSACPSAARSRSTCRSEAAPADPRFDEWRAKLPQPLGSPATFAVAGDRLRVAIPLPANRRGRRALPVSHHRDTVAMPRRSASAAPATVCRRASAAASASRRLRRRDRRSATGAPCRFAACRARCRKAARGRRRRDLALAPARLPWRGDRRADPQPDALRVPDPGAEGAGAGPRGGEERARARRCARLHGGRVVGTGALGRSCCWLPRGGQRRRLGVPAAGPAHHPAAAAAGVAITLNLLGLFKLPVLGGEAIRAAASRPERWRPSSRRPAPARSWAPRWAPRCCCRPPARCWCSPALGLGLALPFLLLAFVPALARKRLPKPGPWMARLQRILAVPMALSARRLWLLWRQGWDQALLLGLAPPCCSQRCLGGSAGRRRPARSAAGVALAALALVAVALLGIGRGEMAVTTRGNSGEALERGQGSPRPCRGPPGVRLFHRRLVPQLQGQ